MKRVHVKQQQWPTRHEDDDGLEQSTKGLQFPNESKVAISLTGNLQLQFFLDMIGSCCSVALAVIIIKSRGYGINVRFALWSSTENIQTTIKNRNSNNLTCPQMAGLDLIWLFYCTWWMMAVHWCYMYICLPACNNLRWSAFLELEQNRSWCTLL